MALTLDRPAAAVAVEEGDVDGLNAALTAALRLRGPADPTFHSTTPCGRPILLADTPPAAAAAAALLSSAIVAAVDAEWRPGGPGPPRAAVVQAALRLPLPSRRDVVLLLDVQALPVPVAASLAALLLTGRGGGAGPTGRGRGPCPVGYGLAGDAAALGWLDAAAGGGGGGEGGGGGRHHAARHHHRPVVELRRAHAALRAALSGGAPGSSGRRAARAAAAAADAGAGRGLAGLVAAATGRPALAKGPASPQLSDWATRPLSRAQVAYAAADAAAVLDVFDALVTAAAGVGGGGGDVPPLEAAAAALAARRPGPPAPRAAPAAAAAAAAAWAAPLSAPPPPSHARDRRPPPRPAPRPWPPGVPPAFVCDEALEGLARQLRLVGVDAASCPPPPARAAAAATAPPGGGGGGSGRGPSTARADARAATARALVSAATAGGPARPRVLLTADAALASAADGCGGAAAHLVTAQGRHAQLAAVLEAFRLGPIDPATLLSRCTACNGELAPGAFPTRADLPARCSAPPAECGPFWVCGNEACAQVYWKGGQYRRAKGGVLERLGAAGLLRADE